MGMIKSAFDWGEPFVFGVPDGQDREFFLGSRRRAWCDVQVGLASASRPVPPHRFEEELPVLPIGHAEHNGSPPIEGTLDHPHGILSQQFEPAPVEILQQ